MPDDSFKSREFRSVMMADFQRHLRFCQISAGAFAVSCLEVMVYGFFGFGSLYTEIAVLSFPCFWLYTWMFQTLPLKRSAARLLNRLEGNENADHWQKAHAKGLFWGSPSLVMISLIIYLQIGFVSYSTWHVRNQASRTGSPSTQSSH